MILSLLLSLASFLPQVPIQQPPATIYSQVQISPIYPPISTMLAPNNQPSTTFIFNAFDPTIGTLDKINVITIQYLDEFYWAFESHCTQPGPVSSSCPYDILVHSTNWMNNGIPITYIPPYNFPIMETSITVRGPWDGVNDFAGQSGKSDYNGRHRFFSETWSTIDPLVVPMFENIGGGPIITCDSGLNFPGGNAQVNSPCITSVPGDLWTGSMATRQQVILIYQYH